MKVLLQSIYSAHIKKFVSAEAPVVSEGKTESASIVMRKTLLNNMKALINYGVSFSLDDFGNGQSNLNYIVDMPVHIVKFDRDMTQV